MTNDIKPSDLLSTLSIPHQTFLQGILEYKTPAQAYMRAYPNCTREAASACASRLLTDANISTALNYQLDLRAMQAREIVDRQGGLARVSIGDIVEMVDEPILDRHGIPLDSGATRQVPHLKEGALDTYGYAIKSIRPANGGGISVELYSVQDALSAMERIRRLVQDTPQVTNVEQVVIYMPDNGRDSVIDVAPIIDAEDVPIEQHITRIRELTDVPQIPPPPPADWREQTDSEGNKLWWTG